MGSAMCVQTAERLRELTLNPDLCLSCNANCQGCDSGCQSSCTSGCQVTCNSCQGTCNTTQSYCATVCQFLKNVIAEDGGYDGACVSKGEFIGPGNFTLSSWNTFISYVNKGRALFGKGAIANGSKGIITAAEFNRVSNAAIAIGASTPTVSTNTMIKGTYFQNLRDNLTGFSLPLTLCEKCNTGCDVKCNKCQGCNSGCQSCNACNACNTTNQKTMTCN